MFRRQEHMAKQGEIRVGIGGWTYEPWRDNFYPADLTQKRELEYASRHVTAIEINGTFYRSQTPATFAKWRDETPTISFSPSKCSGTSQFEVLAEAGEAIERFVNSGLAELGDKLGPCSGSSARPRNSIRRISSASLNCCRPGPAASA